MKDISQALSFHFIRHKIPSLTPPKITMGVEPKSGICDVVDTVGLSFLAWSFLSHAKTKQNKKVEHCELVSLVNISTPPAKKKKGNPTICMHLVNSS